MLNKNKIFLNDIPLDLFLEYFSERSLGRVKNAKMKEELKHYRKVKYKCQLKHNNEEGIIKEKIYDDPNGRGPNGKIIFERIFADELRITGIYNLGKFDIYIPNGLDKLEIKDNKETSIRKKLFKYDNVEYFFEYTFTTVNESLVDIVNIIERHFDGEEKSILLFDMANLLEYEETGNASGMDYTISMKRNEQEKLSNGLIVPGTSLPVSYFHISIFPTDLDLGNDVIFFNNDMDLENYMRVTTSLVDTDSSGDGYSLYKTYYNKDEEILTYSQAFLIRNLTAAEKRLLVENDFYNYNDDIYKKNIRMNYTNEEIQSLLNGLTTFRDLENFEIYNDDVRIFNDGGTYNFKIANISKKKFSDEYFECEFKVIKEVNDRESTKTTTTFYTLVLNPKLYTTKKNSFGKELYRDRNGFTTVEDGYDSLFQAHHKSMRRAFHHLDTNYTFANYMDPGTVFMLDNANEEEYIYYNKLHKNRYLKKVLDSFNDAEIGDYYKDGDGNIRIKINSTESSDVINKNNIEKKNLSSLIFKDRENKILTDSEEFHDVIKLKGTKDFPLIRVYTDENFIANKTRTPLFRIFDEDMDIFNENPDRIFQLQLYRRSANILLNKLSNTIKTIPISYNDTIYAAAKLSDSKDDSSSTALDISGVANGNEQLRSVSLFDNKYIVITLRRNTTALSEDNVDTNFETLEDFDGKYIHIFFGNSETDKTAEKIIGKISYRTGDISFSIINPVDDSKISTVPLMIPDDESRDYFGWDLVIPIDIDSFNIELITEDTAIGTIVTLNTDVETTEPGGE